jgi:hypothetical protein
MQLFVYKRVRSAIRRITILTCFAVFASTGVASASCPSQPASTPFSQWGDTNSYFTVPGGSFEGTAGQVGWNLSNATLTSGNEPFYVNSSTDDQSLTIDAGGSATSPYFCVDNTMSDLHLFAIEAAAGSDLQVNLLVQRWHRVVTVPLADLADGSMLSWAPTGPIDLGPANIPTCHSVMAAVQFVAPLSSGSWQIDDVFVDPYRSG